MGQLQEKYKNYREPQKYMAAGVYPYFREITSKQMTEVTDIDGHKILMFGSNAYQGLTACYRCSQGCSRQVWFWLCRKPFPQWNPRPSRTAREGVGRVYAQG